MTYVDLDPTSTAAITAAAGGSGNVAQPIAYDYSFATDVDTGMPYMRFAITPNNQRGIRWFLPIGNRENVYMRYLLYIESTVKTYMTEIGVKLPGLATEGGATQPELVDMRMEHAKTDPQNPGYFNFTSYWYDAQQNADAPGYGEITYMGRVLQEDRWYCIEQHAIMGTAGVADGTIEIRLDGEVIYTDTARMHRTNAATQFQSAKIDVYHGGLGLPTANIYYRIAKIWAGGGGYIGVPADMPAYVPGGGTGGAWPTWRNDIATVDVMGSIPLTSNLNLTTSASGTIDVWNGLAAGVDRVACVLNGGHGAMENKVIELDLTADAPAWVTLHAGSDPSCYPDLTATNPDARLPYYFTDNHASYPGLPASRHTYYSIHHIASRNRYMAFGGYAVNFLAAGTLTVDGFDTNTNTWDAAGTWASAPTSYTTGVYSVCRDPRNDNIYRSGYGYFQKWDAATATWSTYIPTGTYQAGGISTLNWEFNGSCVDTVRNRLVRIDGPTMRYIDLATYNPTAVAITGTYPNLRQNYQPLIYDPDNDRYLTIYNSVMYAIDPDTQVSTTIMTVPTPTNGVNSRFAYIQDLGGCVYLPSYASNVMFMPTRTTP